MMDYKGYIGTVEYDDDAEIFHGEVINTRDVITFQGQSVAEIKQAFRDSVDDYLEFCSARGETPDKPFSGRFVTRISAELHRMVNVAAAVSGKSLNHWVAEQLQSAVQGISVAKVSGKRAAAKSKVPKKDPNRKRNVKRHA